MLVCVSLVNAQCDENSCTVLCYPGTQTRDFLPLIVALESRLASYSLYSSCVHCTLIQSIAAKLSC